jgi:hypothetical protein
MREVAVQIYAGLGNQIFMIFTALSYYIDNCDKFVIYCNSKFNTKPNYWDTFFSELKANVSYEKDIDKKFKVYKEPHFHYKEIPNGSLGSLGSVGSVGSVGSCGEDLLLEGFFQSHKYFDHNIEKIKSMLKMREKIAEVKNEFSQYFERKTIAVHFRIGDYYYLQNMHPIKKIEYYINAFNELIRKGVNIEEYNILIFCQESDNNVVGEYIKLLKAHFNNLRYVKVSDGIPDWKQLLLMSSADHFVIGNSTFSWMGAYLSEAYYKKEAVVVCPQIWFGPYYSNNQLQDLRPCDWILVDETI